MKIKKEFVTREVAGDTLLVPVGRTTVDLNGMITLNESGAFLWEALPAAENEAALVDRMLEEYEVDRATAAADVAEFLEKLRKLDIIEE